MSIFKETFPKFVTEQLKTRSETISSGINPLTGKHEGSRSDNFYTYTLNKQCILRLSSGVDVIDDNKFPEFQGKPSKSPAESWVLQGGIQWDDIDKKSGGLSKWNKTNQNFDGAYGSTAMRADAKDGYGIVPMPGIIDASIRTKSAYGSLREGKVKFVCHNKRQLEILEALYMRPGYTLLLEWQWTPYIDNEGSQSNDDHFYSDFFNDSTTTKKIEQYILKNKESSGGNYDALIGYCKNFSFTLRGDGGFDCETEIIAKGEVIESLKTLTKYNKKYPSTEPPLYQLLEDIDNLESASDEDKQTISDKLGVPLENLSKYILSKGMDYADKNEYFASESNTHSYIRWDALAYALNSFLPKTSKEGGEGDPLAYFTTYQLLREDTDTPILEPLLYSSLNFLKDEFYNLTNTTEDDDGTKTKITLDWELADMSVNPNICLFQHQLDTSTAININLKDHNHHALLQENLKSRSPKHAEIENLVSELFQRSIGNTWICVGFLKHKFYGMYYDGDEGINKDFNLYTFVETVWEAINGCSEGHDFRLDTDNRPGGDVIRVIDFKKIDEKEISNINDIHELKILSPDSVVRDISYNTTIPSALSSTIAIAAQSPDSIDDLDKVSFAAINKGVEDRFSKRSTSTNPSDEKHLQGIHDFKYMLEDISVAIGYTDDKKTTPYVADLGRSMAHSNNRFPFAPGGIFAPYGDEGGGLDSTPKSLSKSKTTAENLKGIVSRIQQVYGSSKYEKYGMGQYASVNQHLPTLIPLKFNAKLDGISGIIIGNVFKLPKDKLPIGYGHDTVHFIVMGEEQTITSGQDWTTTISGHLILLGGEDDALQKESWTPSDTNFNKTFITPWWFGGDDPERENPYDSSTKIIKSAYESTMDYLFGGDDDSLFINPLDTMDNISPYGNRSAGFHSGIDLSIVEGSPIYAIADGQILYSENIGGPCGGGIMLILNKPNLQRNGKDTKFSQVDRVLHCHCKGLNVVAGGDIVTQGQVIGHTGGKKGASYSGNSQGPHLHLKFQTSSDKDATIDPEPFLPAFNKENS
jgi:murein DD-endopeptidase MepM/ murein hydrolase activator NlpD